MVCCGTMRVMVMMMIDDGGSLWLTVTIGAMVVRVVEVDRWYILGGGVVQIKVKGIEDGGDAACFSVHALCSAQRRVYAIYALGRMCGARVWVCVRLACLCWAHKGDESLKSNSRTCGFYDMAAISNVQISVPKWHPLAQLNV